MWEPGWLRLGYRLSGLNEFKNSSYFWVGDSVKLLRAKEFRLWLQQGSVALSLMLYISPKPQLYCKTAYKSQAYNIELFPSFPFTIHIAFLKNITDDRSGGLHSGRSNDYHSGGMTLPLAVRVRDMLIIHQAPRPLKAIMFPPEPVVHTAHILGYHEDLRWQFSATQTPGSLPTHSVRRSHRLSSDPISKYYNPFWSVPFTVLMSCYWSKRETRSTPPTSPDAR